MAGTMDITPRVFSDSIEVMSLYIEKMRADEDLDTIPDMLVRFNDRIFTNKDVSKDQLRQLAVYATDYIYRFSSELMMRDKYTDVYFTKVIAKLLKSLQEKGVEVFYVLDNELRGDRFELAVDLYELSGAAVVSPYDGKGILSFEEVERRLKSHMARDKNIVYIEKDASVNYMEQVMKMATESRYIGIFRNFAPTSKYLKIL
jgi:hypothetical protein